MPTYLVDRHSKTTVWRRMLMVAVAVAGFAAIPAVASSSTPYDNLVLSASPVAYFPLDDPAGSTAAVDATGNGHTAAIVGAVAPQSPPLITSGSSFSFAGGYLAPANSGDFLTVPVTFELWVRPDAIANQTIMSDEGDNGSYGYGFRLRADGSYWFLMGGAGYGTVASSAPGSAGASKASYLVGTYDGSTLSIYVNGVLASSAPVSATPNSNLPLNIGRFQMVRNTSPALLTRWPSTTGSSVRAMFLATTASERAAQPVSAPTARTPRRQASPAAPRQLR